MIYKLLFPTKPNGTGASLFLLAMRIFFGLLLMNHGIQKLIHFQELSLTFPDPLHMGSTLSLAMAIFAELVCSIGFVTGILYRLSMLPMMFTMVIAYFVIHANDAFAVKELAFVYLGVFILMYIAGPGKFSVDYVVGSELNRRKQLADKK